MSLHRAVFRRWRPGSLLTLVEVGEASFTGQKKYAHVVPGISRFIKEVNFERVPGPKTSMIINLPDDLNFRGVDVQTGFPTTLSLLQTMVRGMCLHIFNPDKNTCIIDMNRLLREHLIFVKSGHADISNDIYTTSLSRHPVSVRMNLCSFRKSVFATEFVLSCNDIAFATITLNGICLSKVTRKSTPLPDWWQEKYASLSETMSTTRFKDLERGNEMVCRGCTAKPFVFPVPRRDMDWNGHVSVAMYIQYCIDALEYHVYRNKIFTHITNGSLSLKSADFLCKGESETGDILTVAFWDEATDSETVCFDISKSGCSIYQARMKFY